MISRLNLHFRNWRYHVNPVIVALLCAVIVIPGARAETINSVLNPRGAGGWVSDMAGVLQPSTVSQLNQRISQAERQTTAEIAVVTIERTDGSPPKQFATTLFNHWGIGKRGKDNGVLLLLVTAERRIEIETGDGLRNVLSDSQAKAIVADDIVSRFKSGDYDGGFMAGVAAVIDAISKPPKAMPPPFTAPALTTQRSRPAVPAGGPAGHPAPPPSHYQTVPHFQTVPQTAIGPNGAFVPHAGPPNWAPSSPVNVQTSPGSPLTGLFVMLVPLAIGAAILFLVVNGIGRLFGGGSRKCAQCGLPMQRLDETQDDSQLAPDQQFEESLGGVDYRVWWCNQCQAATVERAVKWFSPYSDCPACRHRTLSETTTVTRQPSYDWDGESLVTRTCRFPNCGFSDTQQRRVPRLTQSNTGSFHQAHMNAHQQAMDQHNSAHQSQSSSHDSGGNFGGGHSSGGGAGASF